MGFSWILGEDLTLDLGTSNTLIYSKRKDGKIMEPSVVAVDLNNYEIVAVGEKAKNMEGKNSRQYNNIGTHKRWEDNKF